jgi:hypothetical protein
MPDPGDGDAGFNASGNRIEAQAVEISILHHERAAFERVSFATMLFGKVCGLACGIDAKDALEQQQRADDAHDGCGIRDGVSQRGQRQLIGSDLRERAERLRAGSQRWCIGRGAGEDAQNGRGVEVREPAGEWGADRAENDDRRSEHVHLHALLSQRGHETGAELESDRENEEDQPELLHEVERVVVQFGAEVSDEDSCKEHARRAEPDATEFQAAERHAHHAHEGEHTDGVRNGLSFVELEEPAHG